VDRRRSGSNARLGGRGSWSCLCPHPLRSTTPVTSLCRHRYRMRQRCAEPRSGRADAGKHRLIPAVCSLSVPLHLDSIREHAKQLQVHSGNSSLLARLLCGGRPPLILVRHPAASANAHHARAHIAVECVIARSHNGAGGRKPVAVQVRGRAHIDSRRPMAAAAHVAPALRSDRCAEM